MLDCRIYNNGENCHVPVAILTSITSVNSPLVDIYLTIVDTFLISQRFTGVKDWYLFNGIFNGRVKDNDVIDINFYGVVVKCLTRADNLYLIPHFLPVDNLNIL